jgi:hypothetical protein
MVVSFSTLFNFFWMDGLWHRRLTTEDAEGTESCCFLCALCGFPKSIPEDNKKSQLFTVNNIHNHCNVLLWYRCTISPT